MSRFINLSFLPALALLLGLLAGSVNAADTVDDKHASARQAAMEVLDDFMRTFNRRDVNAWGATLNYPHVRFASDSVRVWQNIQEFTAKSPFANLGSNRWDHSHWLRREVVLASAAKVHIATTFERFDANNESIGVYESLYIVTRVNGKWGIQARSSLAP